MNMIRPMAGKVLVERKPTEVRSKGGVILPHETQVEQNFARVLAVGAGVSEVTVGNQVLLAKFAGVMVEYGIGEKALLVDAADILGLVE